jgi:hypothetical protein
MRRNAGLVQSTNSINEGVKNVILAFIATYDKFFIYHLGHERLINYRRHQPETRYDSTATLQADEVVACTEGHTSTIQGNYSSEDVSQRAITGCHTRNEQSRLVM